MIKTYLQNSVVKIELSLTRLRNKWEFSSLNKAWLLMAGEEMHGKYSHVDYKNKYSTLIIKSANLVIMHM